MDLYNLLLLVLLPVLYVLGTRIRAFSRRGGIAAVFIGMVVIIGGGALYFLLLFLFLGLSYITTVVGFERKKRRSLQEGIRGERKAKNVLAAGLVPSAVSLLSFSGMNATVVFSLYVISLATILADTAASEIGSLDDNTYMILTLRPAQTGINGGISVLGTVTSLIFSVTFGLLSFLLFGLIVPLKFSQLISLVFLTGFVGFIGNLFDSVLGETLENRGYLDKYSVNFYATLFSTLVGLSIMW